MFKPRLLRETAEIALTEIKRFVENRLAEDFSLRRVSAPLYLPVLSGLSDPGETVRFTLPGRDEEMAIVRGLDRWLREQLVRYDIAPGFGVYTVMNALRPEIAETTTTSPHLTAWAWQQVVDPHSASADTIVNLSRQIYSLFEQVEQMVMEQLPHLTATLPRRTHVVTIDEMLRDDPDSSQERREYSYLRSNPTRALIVVGNTPAPSARILVWNDIVSRPLTLAETTLTLTRPVASVGGNILRDPLAMQVLHQPRLLR